MRRAGAGMDAGTVQLAVTDDGGLPLGEVLLFGTEESAVCEFAYAIGEEHRGRSLAARAVRALYPTAWQAGYVRARVRVTVDNVPSQAVARAAGFAGTADPLIRRERKGHVLDMET